MTPFGAWHMSDMTSPGRFLVVCFSVFNPNLDNERMRIEIRRTLISHFVDGSAVETSIADLEPTVFGHLNTAESLEPSSGLSV